jgi:glyoxylate reductase
VPVGGELLDRAGEQLKVVANFAVGFDNIDTTPCASAACATNTPDVLTNATVELAVAVALIRAAGRRIVEIDQIFRRGNWVGWEPGSSSAAS